MLVCFLMIAFSMSGIADDSGTGEDNGFYAEELPENGETDMVFFSDGSEPLTSSTTASEPPAQTTPPQATPTPEEVSGTPAPSSSEEQTTPAPTPAPEPQPKRAASGLRDNLPVMIVVAVVALSALAAAVVKKRKTTNRPPEAKRPNDIGGRK